MEYTKGLIVPFIDRVLAEEKFKDTTLLASYICPSIQEGTLLLKRYDIFDPENNLYVQIDELDKIYNFLNGQADSIENICSLFNKANETGQHEFCQLNAKKNVIPFSSFLQVRTGQCFEMAIASQLQFQKNRMKSVLCSGRISNNLLNDNHAWNLLFKQEEYHIWDCGRRLCAPIGKTFIYEDILYLVADYTRNLGNPERAIYIIGDNV